MEGDVTGTGGLAGLEPFCLNDQTPSYGILSQPKIWEYRVVPLSSVGRILFCATDDAQEIDVIDTLFHLLKLEGIRVVQVGSDELDAYMDKHFPDGKVAGMAARARKSREYA